MSFLCDNLRGQKIIFEYKLRHLMARVRYQNVHVKSTHFTTYNRASETGVSKVGEYVCSKSIFTIHITCSIQIIVLAKYLSYSYIFNLVCEHLWLTFSLSWSIRMCSKPLFFVRAQKMKVFNILWYTKEFQSVLKSFVFCTSTKNEGI